MYHAKCACGYQSPVRLAQAGETIRCPRCGASLLIPNSSELRRTAGDAAPYDDVFQKIARALDEGLFPFDGTCQQCAHCQATIQVPVAFRFLVRRDVSEHEGIQPSLGASGPGFDLVVGASTESWQMIRFPLLFCPSCYQQFRRDWTRATIRHWATSHIPTLFFAPLILILLVLAFFMPLISIPAVILIIIMAMRHRRRKRVHPFLLAKLQQLPLIAEAIEHQDEYQIRTGAPISCRSPGPQRQRNNP
jgi:uncharacterized C2H2 Zn-finger protein